MEAIFSDRMQDVPRSFIREILKVTMDRNIISFAGGLPNRLFFPAEQLREATNRVFQLYGTDCLQYSNSEGLPALREYISERYHQEQGIHISPANILITNGSQQALDLIAKITINRGDQVIIEEPGYLGAIQALSLYRPRFIPVPVSGRGMDSHRLAESLADTQPKMMYTVPNFQNPSGISYTAENKRRIAELVGGRKLLLVEDDPYRALRFHGEPVPSFYHYLPDQTLMLGSFSKVIVPGFRLGWIAAPEAIYEKLLIAKQASDLHTCNFTQYIILEYLLKNNIDEHVKKIVTAYGKQCQAMIKAIERTFPGDVSCTRPDGGMFLWGELPDGLSSLELFDRAVKRQVVFVPGEPFYTTERKTSTFRLNFSCVDENLIKEGISRLAEALADMRCTMSR